MTGAYERFLVEHHDDGVAHLVMNRPQKLNAMDRLFFDELIQVMRDLSADDRVRAVVLTGAGRAFSAGGDIATFPALADVRKARDHVRVVFEAFHAIEHATVPVIAAVNGLAHGGGVEIVSACDFVVAAEHAEFAFREVVHGLMPGFGLAKLQRKIGTPWTLWMGASGEVVDAPTALRLGIAHEVVPADTVVARAHELAAVLAANPVPAVQAVKAFLNRDTADAITQAVETTAMLFATEESQANVRRFLDRPR